MGYYTRFSLEWTATPEWKPAPSCGHKSVSDAKFCHECGQSLTAAGLDSTVEHYLQAHEEMNYSVSRRGKSRDTAKWYEYEAAMREMSRKIPNVLFKLSGEGEESGDIWSAYALNGMWQKHKARIVVDDMNPKGWK